MNPAKKALVALALVGAALVAKVVWDALQSLVTVTDALSRLGQVVVF